MPWSSAPGGSTRRSTTWPVRPWRWPPPQTPASPTSIRWPASSSRSRCRRSIDPDVALPVPEPAPRNAHAATPEVRHGLLEIPAIGLSQTLFEGVTLTAINRGPSHWPGTAMPGEFGNVVVAGHRTTYSRPFYRLNELDPGDELIFTVDGERFVVRARTGRDRVAVRRPHHRTDPDRTATLFGCHPRGSARQRIVGALPDEDRRPCR